MTLNEINELLDAEVLIGEGQLNTADIIDASATFTAHGKKPSPETFQLTEELNIPVLRTKNIFIEIARSLSTAEIRGFMNKVGRKRISLSMKSHCLKTVLPSSAEALTIQERCHTVSR